MMSDEEPKVNKDNLIALRLNSEQMNAVRLMAHQTQTSISAVIRAAIEYMTGAKQ